MRDLQALDRSACEGAAISYDLNAPPLQAHLRERFGVVIDSGTLEHVFTLPKAIATCMQLVTRGGTLFVSSPANNMCGHGFYQFSPEFFFRLFKDANGLSLARLVLVTHPFPGAELSADQTWDDVVDPAEIGAGARLMARTPAFLMMEPQRVEVVPVLTTAPQQSDYVARWKAGDTGADAGGLTRSMSRAIFTRAPQRVQASLTGWYQRTVLCTLRNRRAFRRRSS